MLSNCLNCGACQSVCPVHRLGEASFPLSWQKSGLKPEVWNCTNCWLCQEVCPQKLELWEAKAMTQRQNTPPAQVALSLASLNEIGLSLPLTANTNELRQGYGLDPISFINQTVLQSLIQTK
ncbi:4Fe-4S dicluster domain-containing protein [Desulfitobacterium sp.]|uniref:4Fe-4S dicluster domain-containing protein n=1 Tax=Desulfitobacterium sp. TaxID=49981 RepID=UPI002B200C37|nr:4Fe-4S dicluster domain-containing protein [Desulfitobacterium sp.]MEA4901586.1 4Fe-4S dicluster domain-containing protein [Desulfitobacterium sp.]